MIKMLPVKLEPARVSSLRPGMLPSLPEWYPLDRTGKPDEPTPPPYTDGERRRLRQSRALTEAITGPFDGQRGLVVEFDTESGPPQRWTPISTPQVWYTYDPRDSDRDQLVYRYDPTCSLHAAAMRAVEDAYREQGRDYTIAAREEADHERSAPSKL